MLAGEYGWTPTESDLLDWADISRYIEKIRGRNELKAREKLRDYIMFLQISHTSKPQEMLNSLQKLLDGDESPGTVDEDVGDMKKLRSFKALKRQGRGM